VSSAELVYGSPLTLPGELLTAPEPPAAETLKRLQISPPLPLPTRPLSYAQAAAHVPPALYTASHVYVRRDATAPPLTQLYLGPYFVLRRGPKSFDVEVGTKIETVSIDRLKPHVGRAEVKAANPPPPRGRPKKKPN
jgi:hypothetical protein